MTERPLKLAVVGATGSVGRAVGGRLGVFPGGTAVAVGGCAVGAPPVPASMAKVVTQ